MSKKSIKLNYVYNLLYQVLTLITPLITTPYISRVLGAEGIGKISFNESIAAYFVLFANMGISLYAQRQISYYQENSKKRSDTFWNVKLLGVITTTISLAIYVVLGIMNNNTAIYYVFGLNILAIITDVSWFFQGMEEFGKTVLRNIVFKVINIIFVFTFIKSVNDLVLYVFGICFFLVLGNLSLWFYLPKYITKPRLDKLKPFKDFKVILLLFLPTIAIQVYTILDKTMIGVITQSSFQNGYYEQALKISKIVLTLVTSLGVVMIPRIGFHFSKGEMDQVRSYMYRGYNFVWFLGIPLCFGIVGISNNFVPWFFGAGFEGVIPILTVLSFLILAIGINNVTGMQYLIPTGRENTFTLSVVIGAICNFLLNLILIPRFQALGAAIASVFAESIIAIVQIIMVRKELSPLAIIKLSRKYFFSGIIMLIIILMLSHYLSSNIINTVILIVFGSVVYFLCLYILKDEFFISNIRNILNKVSKIKNKF